MLENIQVVISIDFGTSRSGFAYAFVGDKEAHAYEDWPYGAARYPKTDTHLLYGPDGKVVAWGFEAMARYASLRQKKQDQGYFFMKNFKMALYEPEGKHWDNQRLIFKNGQRVLIKESPDVQQASEFVVTTLVADYLRSLKTFALEKIANETSGLLVEKQVLWCLTVPAIWNDEEKLLMRQAAIQAGLISDRAEDKERLVMVLEPEAAAVHCAERDAMLKISELKDGSRFMIIDAGGGTIDITVHEIVVHNDQHSLEEVVSGLGGPYGSTYIDEQFFEYLTNKLGIAVIQDILENEPIAYREMMAQWEECKCRFSGDRADYVAFIYLQKLYRFLLDRYPNVLKTLAVQQNGIDDALILDNQTIYDLFDPVLKEVEELVEKQFERISPYICDFIFMVGGFSTSQLLQNRIRDKFDQRVNKIITPGEPGAAIELGAVSLGLNPSIVRARRARMTYGTDSSEPFVPGLDPPNKRINGPQGPLCRDRFLRFVAAGQKIPVDFSVKRRYRSVNGHTVINLGVYTSRSINARYIDEKGVQKIGNVEVQLRDLTQSANWVIEATLYFGKSEIKVEVKDLSSGALLYTEVDFHTTFFPEFIDDDDNA